MAKKIIAVEIDTVSECYNIDIRSSLGFMDDRPIYRSNIEMIISRSEGWTPITGIRVHEWTVKDSLNHFLRLNKDVSR